MRTCVNCNKENPDDASYCYKCGHYLASSSLVDPALSPRKKWYSRIPVLGWIGLGLIAIAAFLGVIIGGFWAVATVEGIASLIFLSVGIFLFGVFRKGVFTQNKIFRAIAIGFWALMGASIDQTGNYLYNYPVGMIECPRGTYISRSANVAHPHAGETMITQEFNCYNESGESEKTVNTFAMMGYRFLEYILLAYILIGCRQLVNYLRRTKSGST